MDKVYVNDNGLLDAYVPSEQLLRDLDNRFLYHAPVGNQTERYESIRTECRLLAEVLQRRCPPSRELSIAMTKLDEVMFFANASIARTEEILDIVGVE
jgi:hypothetical protein